jgi:N-methylhydantoinase B
MKFRPYGLAGGKSGAPTRNVLDPDGAARAMPGKFAHGLGQGDALVHEQAGGGGYGDPFTRDRELVAVDVRNEKITVAYARREHGVVLDAAGKVDADATAALRLGGPGPDSA